MAFWQLIQNVLFCLHFLHQNVQMILKLYCSRESFGGKLLSFVVRQHGLVRLLVQYQLSIQFGLSFSVWWVLESCQSVVSLHDIEGCRPPALSTTLLCLNLITVSRPCHYSPEQPSDGRPVGSGGRIPNNSVQSHTLLGTANTHWDGHRLIQTTQTQTEIQMRARPLSRTPH